MANPFHQNIGYAYRALEETLDRAKQEVLDRYYEGTFGPNIRPTPPDGVDIGQYIKDWLFIFPGAFDSVHEERLGLKGRIPIRIGGGYVVKIALEHSFPNSYGNLFYRHRTNFFGRKHEESNVRFLLEHGFTKENGFTVPDHKVVGVKLEDGKAKVDPNGNGWTITEDASENGTYNVNDIMPYHFAVLRNRYQFAEQYFRHMKLFLELCHDEKVDIYFHRHGKPDNPIPAISAMLLLKEKDGNGRVIIGDLDNLEFKVKVAQNA